MVGWGGGRESNCNCGEIENKGWMDMGEGKGGGGVGWGIWDLNGILGVMKKINK